MIMKRVGGFALGVFLMAAAHVEAVPWVEVGDAGDLLGTAQVVTGIGAFDQITGTISSATDVDMFRFNITDPALFSATVTSGTLTNSQLFLFSASGMGIAANDNMSASNLLSALPAGNSNVLAAGTYYLAVSGFNRDPLNGGGMIFPNTSTGVQGPTGPGGGAVVTGWTATPGSTGTYDITLTAVHNEPTNGVPEPGSLLVDLLMLGPGLLGVVSMRRWMKK